MVKSFSAVTRLEREAEKLSRQVSNPQTPETRRAQAVARLAEIDGMLWAPRDPRDQYVFSSL